MRSTHELRNPLYMSYSDKSRGLGGFYFVLFCFALSFNVAQLGSCSRMGANE